MAPGVIGVEDSMIVVTFGRGISTNCSLAVDANTFEKWAWLIPVDFTVQHITPQSLMLCCKIVMLTFSPKIA